VYSVPGHVDGVLGEELRADPGGATLAVGVTAVAFTTSHHAPVAVSATDGRYHLLDLPGFDRAADLRFDGTLALSPDGRRLAYTWNKPPGEGRDDTYVPSGVRIVDLVTGEVASHQVRKGYGVFSHDLTWSPNGRYLVYNTQIANYSQTGTRGVRNFFVERLDTQTGKRSRASGVPQVDHAPGVTDDGTVIAGRELNLWTWRPDRETTVVDLGESRRWRGSVAGIGVLPGSDRVLVSAGLEYSRLYAGRPDDPRSMRQISSGAYSLSPVGPVDGDGQAVFERTPTSTALWTIRMSGPLVNDRSGMRVTFGEDLGDDYSFATSLLQRPTRDFPAPDWPMSMEQKALLGGAAVVGTVAAVWLTVFGRTRRRRREAALP
jgi:hypothetical protein